MYLVFVYKMKRRNSSLPMRSRALIAVPSPVLTAWRCRECELLAATTMAELGLSDSHVNLFNF